MIYIVFIKKGENASNSKVRVVCDLLPSLDYGALCRSAYLREVLHCVVGVGIRFVPLHHIDATLRRTTLDDFNWRFEHRNDVDALWRLDNDVDYDPPHEPIDDSFFVKLNHLIRSRLDIDIRNGVSRLYHLYEIHVL